MKIINILIMLVSTFGVVNQAFAWKCGQRCPSSVFSGKLECQAYNRACKIKAPKFGVPAAEESALSYMTDTYYNIYIRNDSGNNTAVTINGKRYYIQNGYRKFFKFRKCYGTNGSNIKCSKRPKITANNPDIRFKGSKDNIVLYSVRREREKQFKYQQAKKNQLIKQNNAKKAAALRLRREKEQKFREKEQRIISQRRLYSEQRRLDQIEQERRNESRQRQGKSQDLKNAEDDFDSFLQQMER